MSSRRSRSGGTRIGKMLSRKNRSDRNAPRCTSAARSRLVAAMTRASTRSGLRAADALELVLLQHAQQLDLRLERQLPDFVQEDGAAVGQLEAALLLLHRAGEGAALVAEQLALDERGRQRAAVHFDHHGRLCAGSTRWIARAISSLPVPVSPRMQHRRIGVRRRARSRGRPPASPAERPVDLAEVQVGVERLAQIDVLTLELVGALAIRDVASDHDDVGASPAASIRSGAVRASNHREARPGRRADTRAPAPAPVSIVLRTTSRSGAAADSGSTSSHAPAQELRRAAIAAGARPR